MTTKILLLYAREDRAVAQRLRKKFAERGLQALMVRGDLTTPRAFDLSVDRRFEPAGSAVAVALFTRAFVDGGFLTALDWMARGECAVLLFLFDESPPVPDPYAGLCLDGESILRDPDAAGFPSMLEEIGRTGRVPQDRPFGGLWQTVVESVRGLAGRVGRTMLGGDDQSREREGGAPSGGGGGQGGGGGGSKAETEKPEGGRWSPRSWPPKTSTGELPGGGGEAEPTRGEIASRGERPARSEFHVLLEGGRDRVLADQVVIGSEFALVFDLDVTPDDALAWLAGERLERLREAPEADLSVLVTPPEGLESLPGEHYYKTVKLRDGKLDEPVSFGFRASGSAKPGDRRFQVALVGDSDLRYLFALPFRLVEELEPDAARTPPRIDLDADEITSSTARRADWLLNIHERAGEWTVYRVAMGKGDGGNYTVKHCGHTSAKIDQLIRATNLKAVASHPVWADVPSDLGELEGENRRKAVRKCLEETLQAGHDLHEALRTDRSFREVMDWIEALPEGARLTILTNVAFLPWEIIYPIAINAAWPESEKIDKVKPERLWGCRFKISLLPSPEDEGQKLPPRQRQPGPLKIEMALDEKIDSEFQDDRFRPVKFHADLATDLGSAVRLVKTHDELASMALDRRSAATLIYFFCHGESDRLVFANGFTLTQNYLNDAPYSNWPIVFFNSCSAGAVFPLSYNTFLRKFIKKQAWGMLGSYFPLPTRFAAAFGGKLIRRYAAGEEIGEALHDLRRELALRGNPMGLFYSLQCPGHVQAPKGG